MDRAFTGWKHACQQIKKSGFPSSIGAKNCHHFVFGHLEIHMVNRYQGTKAFGDALGL
jgi:hypothetical protein